MLHFIYTYSETERPKRNGHTYKTVTVFRIKRNRIVRVGTSTDTFVDEFQLVRMCLEENKALPKKAFERHPMGGWMFGNSWALKEAGIADIQRIS